jgi:hypothetical protein
MLACDQPGQGMGRVKPQSKHKKCRGGGVSVSATEEGLFKMSPYAKWIVAGYVLSQGSLIVGIAAKYKLFGTARVAMSLVFLLHVIAAAIVIIFA